MERNQKPKASPGLLGLKWSRFLLIQTLVGPGSTLNATLGRERKVGTITILYLTQRFYVGVKEEQWESWGTLHCRSLGLDLPLPPSTDLDKSQINEFGDSLLWICSTEQEPQTSLTTIDNDHLILIQKPSRNWLKDRAVHLKLSEWEKLQKNLLGSIISTSQFDQGKHVYTSP